MDVTVQSCLLDSQQINSSVTLLQVNSKLENPRISPQVKNWVKQGQLICELFKVQNPIRHIKSDEMVNVDTLVDKESKITSLLKKICQNRPYEHL